MNQAFYIGAVGAREQQRKMNIQGNNIANANTFGFKAEKGCFTALMYENMKGIDEAQLPAGVGACLWTSNTDFAAGAGVSTGRAQDYMIDGEGFFALVDLNTNEISLTRNGSFSVSELLRPTGEVDEYGQAVTERVMYLSDGDGRFVLSRTGGMIEVTNSGAEQPVGIFDYNNYNGMEHLAGTRFLAVEKNGGLRLGSGKLVQGMLEMSNIDLAEEMTKVIEAQRVYSMALKMVQTSDEIETTINNLRS